MRPTISTQAIIDDLYQGTLDDAAWGRAFEYMSDLIAGMGCMFLEFNPMTGVLLRDESHRVDPVIARVYREDWAAGDIRFEPGLKVPIGEGQFIGKVLPARAWQRSAILNDFLAQHDVPYYLAFWLHKAEDKIVALSFQATHKRGPFDENDDHLLRPLMLHVRRAMEIRDRLEAKQIRADTLATCLDRVSFGVLVLDETGKVLETNTQAEQLLRTESVVRIELDRRLWLQGEAGVELQRWIATGTPATSSRNGALLIYRANGRRPISAVVTPLPDVPISWMTSNPRWLILLFDPEQRIQPAAETLAYELCITQREAELATFLSIGCDLQSAAQRLGISVHTARTHLKSIFAKTGIHSQTELVRWALCGLAAMRTE